MKHYVLDVITIYYTETMSKKYQREEKEIERLEEQVRDLKAQKRQLERRLKTISKGYRAYLDNDLEEPTPIKKEEKKMCWDCGVGEYKLHIIVNRRFRKCEYCGKRGKVKIV